MVSSTLWAHLPGILYALMDSAFVFIYDLAIQFYLLAIRVSSSFNPKAKQFINGRKNLLNEIKDAIHKNEYIVWMHCASVGEYEQGRPVIEKLKAENNNIKVLLTFFSPSGYLQRKNSSEADYIFYLPIDTKKNAENFIRIINPQFVIFVKYEFWFHHLIELKKKNIPTILISGIFRREQLFFRWFGKPFLAVIKSFNKIFVQDKNSFALLNEFALTNAVLSSDTRFDRVLQVKNNSKQFPEIEKFCFDNKVIIAGSTWPEDEKLLIQFITQQKKSGLKWIIAPHEISEKHIGSLINQLGEKTIRFSQIQNASNDKQFLVIDNIGMLSSNYQYGTIAYVGGGFGKGIHNILEASVYGVPVLFGPNYKKFREANDLIQTESCFSIQNENEFDFKINQLLNDKKLYSECSIGCYDYVKNNSGATDQIVQYIKKEIFKK